MGLMDFIRKQFMDVIQWTEHDEGTLAWRFSRPALGHAATQAELLKKLV